MMFLGDSADLEGSSLDYVIYFTFLQNYKLVSK